MTTLIAMNCFVPQLRANYMGLDLYHVWVHFKKRRQVLNRKLLHWKGSLYGGVAVTVAVHCSTSATFQAFTSDPLCAQDFFKLLVKREFQDVDPLTVDDS